MRYSTSSPLFFCLATVLLALGASPSAFAQYKSSKVVNYKEQANEPNGINDIWLHLQPMAADAFMSNMTIGYGLQLDIWPISEKLNIRAAYRGSWGSRFDIARSAAQDNAQLLRPGEETPFNYTNKDFSVYSNFEVVGTYHYQDKNIPGPVKIVLTPRKQDRAKYSLVDRIAVTGDRRQIIGPRLGGFHYATTTDLTVAMEKQDNPELIYKNTDRKGEAFDTDMGRSDIFTNLSATGLIVGGSFTSLHNVTVDADSYGELSNNIMFMGYVDALIAPWVSVDDLTLSAENSEDIVRLSTENLETHPVGWRIGFDLMYNQDIHWSFGGEIGARPSLRKRGIYVMFKVGLPAFSFKFPKPRTANPTGSIDRRRNRRR